MRGELSDALERLARRDEALRRRAASEDPSASASAAAEAEAEDLVAAARRLVERHPDVSITLTIERGQTRSSVRLVHGQDPYVVEVGPPYPTPPDSTGSYDHPSGRSAASYYDYDGRSYDRGDPGYPEAQPRYGDSGHRDPVHGGAPTAGVRPVDLGADETVVLDTEQRQHSPASRLADLLRDHPTE